MNFLQYLLALFLIEIKAFNKMAIVHTLQTKNGREALFASITVLRKALNWIISEVNTFFAFHNLVIPVGTRKIHFKKNWDVNIPHTLVKSKGWFVI